MPEIITDDLDIRITRTTTALYIISMRKPTTPQFDLPEGLPALDGDRITWDGQCRGRGSLESNGRDVEADLDSKAIAWAGQGIAWALR